jgi:ferredoxin like protein
MSSTLRVEDKLGVNKYHTDETHAHIEVDKNYADETAVDQLMRVCPAGIYKKDPATGNLTLEYLGCLECGTCRVLSGKKAVKNWNYPVGSLGVEYRFG